MVGYLLQQIKFIRAMGLCVIFAHVACHGGLKFVLNLGNLLFLMHLIRYADETR